MADRAELEAAAQTVRSAPHSINAWEEVEGLASELERPDDVIALYREVLADDELGREIVEMIGERAASFCDEWFGDEPKVAEGLLRRVIERAPLSESALQRLSVLYTGAERWTDLFALYDRALGAAKDRGAQIKLLREASQLAKDVAGQPERAIGYLQRLLPLTPDDVTLAHGLERLLERHERWADLIALWEGRLETQQRKEREKTRARIAACFLDNLHDAARALAAARPLLAEASESGDDTEACALLERILESAHTTTQVREGALDLLRAHYDAGGKPREVIRVLERVIAIDPAHAQALREEAGARLAELDDDGAAMDQYATLLAHAPDSSVTQEKLRQLAQRSGNYRRYAEGVAAAAAGASSVTRRVELLAEAARTRLDLLDDPPGAIELYSRALAEDGIAAREQLMVCRRLSELYARTDQPRERLLILDRLGDLEADGAARRVVVGEAARLAESLGEIDLALVLWRRRIDRDAGDLPAIDALIALLEAAGKWSELIPALEARSGQKVTPAQKKSDLARIAVVHAEKLADNTAAIGAWQRVIREFGDDAESVGALADLYAAEGRWRELADLLEGSAARDVERTTVRLVRLADALREHLDAPDRALVSYRGALAIDSRHDGARRGLLALLEVPSTRRAAADALAASYRDNADWAGFLEILPARLAEAPDARTRLNLLREAAQLQIQHTHDRAGALANLAAAFPLAPRDGMIEAQLLDLARDTRDWATASKGLADAIANLGDDPHEAARLHLVHADLLEQQLADAAAALSGFRTAATTQPGNARAVQGVIRLAPALGRWDDAARVALAYFAARDRFDEELLGKLVAAADELGGGAFDALVAAMNGAMRGVELSPSVAAEVEHTLARWQRDRGGDAAAAIASLERTLALGGDRREPLEELAERLRAQPPGAKLLDVLRRLADVDARDLDVLVEAGDVASKLADREQAIHILGQVLGRATAAWRGTSAIRSSRPPEAVARWAIDGLVELQVGAGRPRAAVDLLVEAARLPFDDATRRELRLRAAAMAERDLGDAGAAIDMYRGVLADSPGDLPTIGKLGALLEQEGRTAELLGLRKIQLGLEPDPARRLELRLDIARLVGIVEEQGGRLEALLANLADQPGHAESIDAVAAMLAGKGQHKQLADLLEKQAATVEGGDAPRAARLWARYAAIAERDTREIERAIAGHRRVVALQPTADSLRALARLYLERGQPAQAVTWFESLLATTPAAEKPAIVLQLARAHLDAGAPDRAIAAIEANLDDREPAVEARTLLADLYRKAEQWEPLARHLTRSLILVGDQKLAGDYAREAASIYTTKLDAPAKAIPAIEKALELDPTDKALRGQLATGLRVAGRLSEARTILGELIADFGRRRSAERAALHVELAQVAQAEGKLDEALAEMADAAKMDVNNATIQRGLAEMQRAAGQLDKAERTYRALLLVVRRQPPGDDEAAVGPAEVLFELHAIARHHGQDDQAKELLESAIDAAVQSDAEVRRLRRSLLAHGETDTLLRVLELRLAQSTEGASQARLLADKADVLEKTDRAADALGALLDAIGKAPSRLDLHDRARALARQLDATRRYVEAVETTVERLRRKTDPPLVASLLMKAGEALELDADDLRGAAALYKRVEMLGERLAEAYYAQARIAGAIGDTDEQARALDAMLQLAGSAEEVDVAPEQVDALYRLAEIFLGTPARRRQGIGLIERAFGAEPRWAQAGRVLKAATAVQTGDEGDARLMSLYERVARNGGDGELLLDFLEKRSRHPGATPGQIREAVDVAIDVGQPARAEALLARAIEAARETVDGVAGAIWAVVALAERRIEQGQLGGARELIDEIAPIAEPAQVDPLARKLAAKAAETPRAEALAAEMYELLRERHPADRTVWEPLIELYRRTGDADRLANVVSSTLPGITDAAERNALRRAHARYLLDQQRPHDAVDVLRDALLDDPDDLEVAGLLEATLRATGDDSGLSDFLWGRFEDAQKRGNQASIIDVAIRLGELLDGQGVHGEAARVYRAALEHAPEDRELLRRVVAHLTEDDDPRAGALLMERLLAVETPDEATRLCWQLASMWEAAGDEAGVQRTLEAAQRSAPDDQAIHDRLESWYRDKGLWAELADLLTRDAERASDAEVAVARLREAAGVYSGFLGRPLDAARVLRAARQHQPHAAQLVTDLAAALAAGGEAADAIAAIGEAIDGNGGAAIQGEASVDLLLLRASLEQQRGGDTAAVADLERAYAIDPGRSGGALAEGLERQRGRAEAAGETDTERTATLRLANLLQQTGDLERARTLVVLWIERDPRDPEPLYMLRDMDASIEHWEGVLAACTRLAYIVEGEAQVQAALEVADAAARAGAPGEAIAVLEMVFQQQPDSDTVRAKLREQYEASGAYRELSSILIADADHTDEAVFRFGAYKKAAELLLTLGDAEAALDPARKACDLQPDDQAAAMLYVDALMNAGHTEAAAQALEAAIAAHKKRSPELAVLQQRMGRVAALMGDRDGQLGWLKKAFDVDRKNGEVAAELAQLATEVGDYELALKPLRAITLMENPFPVTRPMALLWEAKIEHARGNRAKAELWAKKALREDPQFSEAQQFLDEIG